MLPLLSDIPTHYYSFCCLSWKIYAYINIFSVASVIRYTLKIYCLFCLSFQIYTQNITLSFACPLIYTPTLFLFLFPFFQIYPTILLFLLPFLSDITLQYYCFFCLSHQISSNNIIVSLAFCFRYTPIL